MTTVANIKEIFEKSRVAVTTVSKENKPYAIVIMYPKIKDGKIVITDNYMKTTVENIKNNNNVCLIFWKGEKGWRIEGQAEYFDSGTYLDYVKTLKENKGLSAKGAVVVLIKKITELG